LATNLVATTGAAPSFAATILAMEKTIGLPKAVLRRHRLCERSRRRRAGDQELRTAGGDWPNPAAPAL
jgi:hypothetical protein